MIPLDGSVDEYLRQLRRLRIAVIGEGVTLVILVVVAVPLKHIGGYEIATSIVGPIHGLAFLFYLWTLIQTATVADWPLSLSGRLTLTAVIPFGAIASIRQLRRIEATLAPAAV